MASTLLPFGFIICHLAHLGIIGIVCTLKINYQLKAEWNQNFKQEATRL